MAILTKDGILNSNQSAMKPKKDDSMTQKTIISKPKWITEVKAMIVQTAKEAKCTEIEIISAMQSHCAKVKDEATLEILCELKGEYIPNI